MTEQSDLFADIPELKAPDIRNKLEKEYLIPPFSVLDTRQGYWQDRKRLWLSLGIESEIGRSAKTYNDHEWVLEKTGQVMPGMKVFDSSEGRDDIVKGAVHQPERGIDYFRNQEKIFNSGEGRESKGKNTFEDLKNRTNKTESIEKILSVGGQSIFDPVLCELMYRWFCPDKGVILDPFSGGSVRGIVASVLGYQYHGIDLSEKQIEANRGQAKKLKVNGINWYVGNSKDIDSIVPQEVRADMIFSCPPYFDLEQYSRNEKDLSNMNWLRFKDEYKAIIKNAVSRLEYNRFACFVVSEIRDDKGCFRKFVPLTIEAFCEAGMRFYNEIILVNTVGSLSIRVANQFTYRKIGRTHQNILIFFYGNPDQIPNHFKEIKQEVFNGTDYSSVQ